MICDATIVGHLLAAHHVIQVYIQKLSDGFLILTAVFFLVEIPNYWTFESQTCYKLHMWIREGEW